VVVFLVALALIIYSARRVHPDHVPRVSRPRKPARELGTVVVARVLADGSETPRTVAAPLLASRLARPEIASLGGDGNG
jgi:hypothetical protein